MCRNIKTLYNFDPPASTDEVQASSLQFVRKLSGMNKPSKQNEEAFQPRRGARRGRRSGDAELAHDDGAAPRSRGRGCKSTRACTAPIWQLMGPSFRE